MIKLSRMRTTESLPRDFQDQKLRAKHVDLLKSYFKAQSTSSPIKFSSAKWKSAKTFLKRDTGQKCAYCEAPTAVVAHGDVEHFRPKAVYWWLAFTFDNYLYACQICNQSYKGDIFPVTGKRLPGPRMPSSLPDGPALDDLVNAVLRDATKVDDEKILSEWRKEKADLVHPYLDDPETLFRYEADETNNEIWLRAASGVRAKRALSASHNYLGLNREELRKLRYQEYQTLLLLDSSYRQPEVSGDIKNKILREFDRRTEAKFPFAGMNRYFLKQWGY
jgi:hypothetical protein